MSRSTISTFQLFEMFPTAESARLYLECKASSQRVKYIIPFFWKSITHCTHGWALLRL